MHWVYYFGRGLIHILAFPFGGWKTVGRENINEKGPFLIVSNHLHVADPPILAASLPLKCVFMAKNELWDNAWSRFWVKNFGAFPVRENGADREAFRQTEKWLERGISVVMFPEGGRSRSGRLQTALPGAAVIVARLGVPVLPVSISGTDKLRNIKRAFWHHPHLKVTIGTPFRPDIGNGRLTREQRREIVDSIMHKIAAILPPEYRGVYAEEKIAGD